MTHTNKKRNFVHTPASRRFFWWFLFASNIIITATVIFYTLGYRFNFTSNIFIHTGSLSVNSEPEDLEILIDGKEPSGRHLNFINNSYHITGLFYGPHTVSFSAPGYKTWEDEVIIKSGIATEFWNVTLVKESYERTPYEITNPQALYFAPGNDLLAYPEQSDSGTILTVANVTDSRIENLAHLTESRFVKGRENIEWSPQQDKLIVPMERAIEIPLLETLGAEGLEGVNAENTNTGESDEQPLNQEELGDVSESTTSEEALDGELISDTENASQLLENPEKDYLIATRDDAVGFRFVYIGSILKKVAEDNTEADELAAGEDETLVDGDDNSIESEKEEVGELEGPVADGFVLPTISHVRWLPNEENVLYAILDGVLTRVDISSFVSFSVDPIMENVVAYDFADDGIYILDASGTLYRDNNQDAQDPFVLTKLSDVNDQMTHRLTAYDKDRVMHIENESGVLTIFNRKNNQTITRVLANNIRDARFSDDGKKMMYYSDREISVYFTRVWDAQPFRAADTINRIFTFDTDITTVEWLPDYEHLIVASDSRIQLIDLDYRGDHNLTEITTHAPDTSDVIMDVNNNFIFFTDVDGEDVRLQSIVFPKEKGLLN